MIPIIKRFVNDNRDDIILVLIVILISLLSFAAGFIFSRWSEKGEIKFERVNEINVSLLNETEVSFRASSRRTGLAL